MCLGVPARIVSISPEQPHVATVDVRGTERDVNIAIIQPDEPQPGTWVDIHMGMAVAVLEAEEAKMSLEFLDELERAASGDLTS
jgi:hydrogenase expression/formation protein HypC